MIILECKKPFQRRVGVVKTIIKIGVSGYERIAFTRVWWLWFAVTYVGISHKEYHDLIASGATYWED